MQILYFHQYFKTPEEGGALRSYIVANHWQNKGHRVTVITTHNYQGVRVKNINGIKVHYLPVTYRQSFGPIRRIGAFCKYLGMSIFYVLKMKEVDLVYATSTPLTVGLIALFFKKLKKWPYCFEIRDPWPDIPLALGYFSPVWQKKIVEFLEKVIYLNACQNIVLSNDSQGLLGKKYPGITFTYIPHFPYGWAVDIGKPPEKAESLPHPEKLIYNQPEPVDPSAFIIGYCGAMGFINGLEDLLEKAEYAGKNEIPVEFWLAGEGSEKASILSRINASGLTNVRVWNWLKTGEVREFLQRVDASFISFLPVQVLSTLAPNKYVEGLASSSLIITTLQGWMEKEISDHACGFFSPYGSHESFFTRLSPFLNDVDTLKHFQNNAYNLAVEKYHPEKVLKKLDEVVLCSG